MYGQLIEIVGSIVGILSKIRIETSKRKTIGRTFAKLYMDLSEIIEDVEKILQVRTKPLRENLERFSSHTGSSNRPI